MYLFISNFKIRYPELAQETLELALSTFQYTFKKSNNHDASEDETKTFFNQFKTSTDLLRWLLSMDPSIIREVKIHQIQQ